ncbi:MAG TPA: thioredoxin family protein [Acidobacteriaceae bacterium]|nr:thioredoxin family protein [Acidobacteriaceae bacterium]
MLIRRFSPRRRIAATAFVVTLFASPLIVRAAAPDAGPSAAEILQRAESQARSGHKNIMLEFGASWCINCKLYDRMLDDHSMHAILSRYFVFTTMDTGERPNDHHHADTPGGVAFENSIGGKNAGWPFLVILNHAGKPIVNSDRPDPKSPSGDNIGYPVLPQEVDWFIVMLRRGAPSMSQHDLDKVHAWLTARATTLQQ